MIHEVYIASRPGPPLLAPVKYSGCAVDGKDAGFLKVKCDCTELEGLMYCRKIR
jgi:hypothetical protein